MLNILKKYFGYSSFKPVQKEIITSIINGKNTLAVLPTGAGKSLCYQLPALMSESFSIVISPLIALMKDQVDSINKKEKLAAYINSSLDYSESEKVLYEIWQGKIKLLYVSPEKLANTYFVERIKKLNPDYLFIDEAHCISQWGHNFRPNYRRIKEFADFIGIKNISGFTATATPIVQEDIVNQLGMENPQIFVSGFERDNLFLNVIHTKHKKEKALKLLKENLHPAIIYTSTRKNAEELNDYINLNGIEAEYYHAGLASGQRKIIQDDFLSGRLNVIIATNAFGMGIDKENIRTIIHYNCTGTIENYYQEIGRAGRDGKDSNIFLLYDLKDKIVQEYFIKNNFPTNNELKIVYNTICNFAEVAIGTRLQNDIILEKQFFLLLSQQGITKLKFNSAINFLSISGYFEQVSQYGREYFFRFIFKDSELKKYITSLKNKNLKDFILILLNKYRGKAFLSQIPIDFDNLSKDSSLPKAQLLIHFETLRSLGIITFNKPTKQPVLKMLQERIPFEQVKLDTDNLQNLINNAYKKLEEMIEYTYTEKCRFNYILSYFGEVKTGYKCGHCDNCLRMENSSNLFNEYIEDKILLTIHEAKFIVRKNILTKILLGRDKTGSLKSLSTYGSCEQYKKYEIDNSIDSLFSKGLLKIRNNSYYLSEKGQAVFIEIGSNLTEGTTENKSSQALEADKTLELYNILRESRKYLSKKYSQPPQYICSDKILRSIAKEKPKNPSELTVIPGITRRMQTKISEEFLFEINEFNKRNSKKTKKKNSLPDNLTNTMSLINKNYKFEDIVKLTKLPESIVYLQIETIQSYSPKINLSKLLDNKEWDLINSIVNSTQWESIKEIKKALPNKISYAKIKLALIQNGIKF